MSSMNFRFLHSRAKLTLKNQTKIQIKRKFKLNVNSNENESKNATGQDTYAAPPGALRAPRAGSPACVFAFVFVSIYVQFENFTGKSALKCDDRNFDENLRRRVLAEIL